MRTTLTLDDDVAVKLKRAMARQKTPFKEIVNRALRAGLETLELPAAIKPFRVKPFNSGGSLIGSLDNIEEILARVDGEDHQ